MPRAALALLAALPLLACQSGDRRPETPEFLVRVQEDCRTGSAEACTLLQLIQASAQAEPLTPPQRRARLRSQVQRNTDAIMQGVDRARAAPRPPPSVAPDDGSA